MNNISDKLVLTIILITILFVFGLIFSVRSPERKVIDSPILWKDDYSNTNIFKNTLLKLFKKQKFIKIIEIRNNTCIDVKKLSLLGAVRLNSFR